jgi:Flp pilus assembly protein TadG
MKAMIGNFMRRSNRRLADFLGDRHGIAATEFAIIAPIMLLAFFGTVEFCSAVAVDRKLTLTARTLADLTSQQPPSANGNTFTSVAVVVDGDLQNAFTASIAIVAPYDATPTTATLSEIYVDSSGVARVQWSKAATIGSGASQATLTNSARHAGDVVTGIIPAQLLTHQTYLIFSEVNYQYVPTIGYVMARAGINLHDVSYTRPRQSTCIVYNNLPALVSGSCPHT